MANPTEPTEDIAEFELYQDDEQVASTSGRRDWAYVEILRYYTLYSQDRNYSTTESDFRIEEVKRIPVTIPKELKPNA